MNLLELSGLRARYGAADVLHGLDVTVEEGEIVALLGANGSGKSALITTTYKQPGLHTRAFLDLFKVPKFGRVSRGARY